MNYGITGVASTARQFGEARGAQQSPFETCDLNVRLDTVAGLVKELCEEASRLMMTSHAMQGIANKICGGVGTDNPGVVGPAPNNPNLTDDLLAIRNTLRIAAANLEGSQERVMASLVG